jgi:hypothetical protein
VIMDTMKRMNTKTFTSVGLVLVGFLFVTSTARAECNLFPKVPWWGSLDHDKVASFVSRKHEGNWKPYLEKWAEQVDKLKDIHKRESSIFIRYKGKKVKIAGDALENYIKLVDKRVVVAKCLAENANYANFATATGKKSKAKKK